MTLNDDGAAGRTLWERIYATLLEEISSGRYPAGAKLPTEAKLSQRFGVNRHTVRRALEALREEGRIHVRRGSGAFVTQGRFDYQLGPRPRMSRNLTDLGLTPERRVLRLEEVTADQHEARALALEPGAPVIVYESIAEADGVPILYGRTTFPCALLPGLRAALAKEVSITRALAAVGVPDYVRLWTRMIAERPGAMLARHLQMPETHPVLHAESLNTDPLGRPVEYGNTWFCSDRVQLIVDRTTFGPDQQDMREAKR